MEGLKIVEILLGAPEPKQAEKSTKSDKPATLPAAKDKSKSTTSCC